MSLLCTRKNGCFTIIFIIVIWENTQSMWSVDVSRKFASVMSTCQFCNLLMKSCVFALNSTRALLLVILYNIWLYTECDWFLSLSEIKLRHMCLSLIPISTDCLLILLPQKQPVVVKTPNGYNYMLPRTQHDLWLTGGLNWSVKRKRPVEMIAYRQ